MVINKSLNTLVVWVEGGSVAHLANRASDANGSQPPQIVVVDVDNLRAEGYSAHHIGAIWDSIKDAGFDHAEALEAESVFAEELELGISA